MERQQSRNLPGSYRREREACHRRTQSPLHSIWIQISHRRSCHREAFYLFYEEGGGGDKVKDEAERGF